MGLDNNIALIISVAFTLTLIILAFIGAYYDELFPKIDNTALKEHLEYAQTQHKINVAMDKQIQQDLERERLAALQKQQQLDAAKRQEEYRLQALAQEKEKQIQAQKEKEYKAYIKFVFNDPFYKTGKRRVKTTDAKVYDRWNKAVEALDSGASISSVITNVYGMTSSGKTYTAYHNTIKKVYARHREYIERDKK